VDLIVFWDYAAPDASPFGAALNDLRATIDVRETALHLPVADAHPTAFPAALAVEAARAQDMFWAAHETLLAHAPSDEPAIDAIGALVEDRDRFRADVERRSGRAAILEHIALAAASGVHAVPTVFIAGVRYDGEPDVAELTAAIQRLPAYRRGPS
jgi:protein-disulfide isomerase